MAHCRDKDQLSYLEKTLPSLIILNENQNESPVLIHEVLSSTMDSSHE
jgi:thymidine phosphorylase